MEIKNVGTITLSDKVRVTDPYYDIDTWCAGTLDNVLPGKFECSYNQDTKKWFNGGNYERVTSIEVHHKDYPYIEASEYMKDIDVGVDSGQAGIFDFEMFSDVCSDDELKDRFYNEVCDLTVLETQKLGKGYIIIPCGNTIYNKGLVSASGDGDGSYACFVGRNDEGQIVAIKIDYYPDYELLEEIENDEMNQEIF